MFCDFCTAFLNSPADGWSYGTKPFIKVHGEVENVQIGSIDDGKWLACDDCAALIEIGDREGVERRAIEGIKKRMPGTEPDPKEIGRLIHSLHSEFWKGKAGEVRA